MGQRFFEADYYSGFKKVRNKFRKFDSLALIDQAFTFLYDRTGDPIKDLQKQPWNVLLLIKWILIDDEFYLRRRKQPTKDDFKNILQETRDLSDKVRMPDKPEELRLFMRLFAFQQFHYQQKFSVAAFARQFILFNELPNNHFFKTKFFEIIGLSIDKFLMMGLLLLLRQSKGVVSFDFNLLKRLSRNRFSDKEINLFLNAISLDINEARSYAKSTSLKSRKSDEFYEQTIFFKYPVLKVNNRFYPYHENVLFRGIEYYVFDLLKSEYPDEFYKRFGNIFEAYVERLIEYSGSDYFDEKKLIQVTKNKSKVSDFLIFEKEKSIFIEAKGIEIHYKGKTSTNPKVLKGKLKTSAISGVNQTFELIHTLKEKSRFQQLNNYENNFLIVVSFKELFLGNGRDFEETVGKDLFSELRSVYGNELYIPLENIYFVPIDILELWVRSIKKKETSFSKGLERARESDSDPKNSKFDFTQHIADWELDYGLPEFMYDYMRDQLT